MRENTVDAHGVVWTPALLTAILLAFCLAGCTLEHQTYAARKQYIRRAKVWHKTDVSKMNILAGPNTLGIASEQEIRCTYQEPKETVAGFSPKFKCKLPDGHVVRVKFSSREILAEVAGTRLLWALGFYTDEVYPVKVRCFRCPSKNLAKPTKDEPRIERLIENAIIERNFPGKQIGVYGDQGWSWKELDDVDPKVGGSAKAETEALKLLTVFIQHTDNKPSQQRLACYSNDILRKRMSEVCKNPLMMIQDLGATFGQSGKEVEASSAMYLRGWKSVPVWNVLKEEAFFKRNSRRICIGNLVPAIGGDFFDPEISEEGRSFLADLLNQLTDQQIEDLFRVARVEITDEKVTENGSERTVRIQDWVESFKMKRDEVNAHRCI
jgi:hypothetical protein